PDEAVPADGKDDGQDGPRRHEGHDARPAGHDGRARGHAFPLTAMDPAAAGHFTTFQVRDGRARGRELHLDRIVDASRALYGSAPAKEDRKSTRLNSSHVKISYAVFCLKKKNKHKTT